MQSCAFGPLNMANSIPMFRRFSAFVTKKETVSQRRRTVPFAGQRRTDPPHTKLHGNRATEATEDDHRNLVGGSNPSEGAITI